MSEQQLLTPERQQSSPQQPLAALQLELDAERQQLTVERMELAAERADLAAERLKIASEWKRLETECTQLSAEEAPRSEELKDESESTSAASDDDIFARLRALSLLKDDNAPTAQEAEQEDEVVEASIVDEPSRQEPESEMEIAEVRSEPQPNAKAPQPVAGPPHHEGEESIDDYMAKLFARLNGGRNDRGRAEPSPLVATVPATAPAAEPVPARAPILAESTQVVDEPTALAVSGDFSEEEPAIEPLTMMPRRATTQPPVDYRAMRELANMSASSAIGASQRRRWTNSGTVKLGASAALGIFGIAVVLFASSGWAGSAQPTVFAFGAVLFIAGALWMLQGSSLLLMAWRGHGAAKATAAAEKASAADAAKQE